MSNDYWEQTYGMSEEDVDAMRYYENEYINEQREKEEQHDE